MTEKLSYIDQLWETRAKLLMKAQTDFDAQAALKVKCADDIYFWIEHFVWVHEPRAEGRQMIPMSLEGNFAYQKDVIKKILECITEGKDLRIEKSRDMGLTWVCLVVFTWGWLFHGWSFLIGSKNAEAVDKLNNMTTMLPKVRFIIRKLPTWMQPAGFDINKHAGFMNLYNPEKNCTISGEPNSANFATGTRAKAILFDEFSKWQYTDSDAWTSAGAATPCRIAVSTPLFKNNKFYELKDTNIENLTIHYSMNKGKDDKWANKMKEKYSEQEWAQEFEVNYGGTSRALVFSDEITYMSQHLRIREDIEYMPSKPTYIGMDLGMGDATSIGCFQVIGFNERVNLFDYYENHNKDIFFYIDWIKSPDRVWNQVNLGDGKTKYKEGWRDLIVVPDPNQASHRELTSGKSMQQIFENAELEVQMRWVGEIEGISVAKQLLKKLYVKSDLIGFIDALNGWHYDFDNIKREYKSSPVHDKYSHACKMLCYFAAYLDDPEEIRKEREEEIYVQDFVGANPNTGL